MHLTTKLFTQHDIAFIAYQHLLVLCFSLGHNTLVAFTKASISVTIANRLVWGFKQTTMLKYYTFIEILSKLNIIRIYMFLSEQAH